MVVITDGEEAGLFGARAFFRDNPLAAHVGFILNMETRGGGGRAAMFETGAGNGAAIDLYRRTADKSPNSNSLSVFVYKLMPNDTDFTVAKGKGVPGFNYAFIGRQFDYHSPSSTVAALDQGSVQHMNWLEVLPTARALDLFAEPTKSERPARPTATSWVWWCWPIRPGSAGSCWRWRRASWRSARAPRGGPGAQPGRRGRRVQRRCPWRC